MIFAVFVDGRWQPGIGDPTPVGWLTVVAYFLAAFFSYQAWRRSLTIGQGSLFWLGLTLVMVFLGVNKQLDLQTLATQIGRDIVVANGVYAQRRTYQLAFIATVVVVCGLLIPVAFYLNRKNLGEQWPAIVGIILLLGFIVVRACSFHHVDVFLAGRIGGMKWNWVLELGGISLILVGAFRSGKKAQRSLTPDK